MKMDQQKQQEQNFEARGKLDLARQGQAEKTREFNMGETDKMNAGIDARNAAKTQLDPKELAPLVKALGVTAETFPKFYKDMLKLRSGGSPDAAPAKPPEKSWAETLGFGGGGQKPPQAGAPAQQQQGGSKYPLTPEGAKAAIAAGADPQKVMQRLQQQGGAQ
jgi:hypothetical protein